MKSFINKNINILDKCIEESYNYIKLDRQNYKKYYKLIEEYVKQKDMVIELYDIYDEEYNYKNYSDPIIIFTNNIIYNAFELTNLLAKHTSYVAMYTIVPYRIIQIKIDGRIIAVLNRHMLIRKESCAKLCQFYSFIHKNNISYSPPEYFMIRKYPELYNNKITNDTITFHTNVVKHIIKNIKNYVQYDLNKVKKIKVEKKNKTPEVEYILNLLIKKKLTFYRFGWTGCIVNTDERNSLVSDLQKKYSHQKVRCVSTFIQDNSDIRIQLYDLYINDKKYLRLYNLSEYEIIPRTKYNEMYVAHPYVINRLLLIDFIFAYYLRKSVEKSEELLIQTAKLFNEVLYRLEESIDCDLSKYNDYVGMYSDKNIDKNIFKINAVIKDNTIMPVYMPASYKNKTGSFKEIRKDTGQSCDK